MAKLLLEFIQFSVFKLWQRKVGRIISLVSSVGNMPFDRPDTSLSLSGRLTREDE